MKTSTTCIYAFGSFQVYTAEGCLKKDGAIVRITPKAFSTLEALLEQAGSVISKETLLARVWPETFVEEGVLAQNIATVRKVLDANSTGNSYIETVPKRGYRFTAEVSTIPLNGNSQNQVAIPDNGHLPSLDTQVQKSPAEASSSVLTEPSNPSNLPTVSSTGNINLRRRKSDLVPPLEVRTRSDRLPRSLIVLTLTTALLIAGFYAMERRTSGSNTIPRKTVFLVVLPTENYTPDPADTYLSAGVTEQLVSDLGDFSQNQLNIITYPVGLLGKNVPGTGKEIRKQLHADYILYSDLISADDVALVKSRLVNANTDKTVWTSQYQPRSSEIRATSHEVAIAVAKDAGTEVNKIPALGSSHDTQNEQAFREYLQGRYYFNIRSQDGLNQAINHFQRSIVLDPSYGAAYAGIADSNNLLVFYGWSPYREGVSKAMEAAQTALRLDPLSSEAHAAMAYAQFFWKHNWTGASQHFKEAIRLDPESTQARHWYGLFLVATGDDQEARTQIAFARKLNPYSRSVLIGSAYIGFLSHDYDEAIAECDQVLSLYGEVMPAYTVRGLALEQKGQLPEALADFERALKLQGHNSATNLAYKAHAYAMMGRRSDAEKVIAQIRASAKESQYENPVGLAATYAALGDSQTANQWLAKAIDDGDVDVVWLRADPRFTSLQNDPSFQQLVNPIFLTGFLQDARVH